MKDRLCAALDFVVPVNHHCLLGSVNVVVVYKVLYGKGIALHMALMLRIHLIKKILINKIHDEQIS